MKIKKNTDNIEFLYSRSDFKKYGLRKSFKIPATLKVKKFKKSTSNSSDSKTMVISGYASTTDKDRVDDVITMDALNKSKNDLVRPGSRTVFYNHDRSMPIGKVLDTHLDQKGLIVNVQISKADDVKDIRTKIKEGVLNSFSIGGRFKKVQVERDAEGRILSFKVLELDLHEVSVVGIPCNPKASITGVIEKSFKSFNIKGKKTMKKKAKIEEKAVEKKVDTTVTKKIKTLTKKRVKAMIDAAINPLTTGLKDLTKSMSDLTKVMKGTEKKEEKKTEEVTQPTVIESIKELTEKISKLEKSYKKPSRKGHQVEETEEDETEETEDSAPKKVLKSADDEATIKYALYAMNNSEIYEKLSVDEKNIVKTVYFATVNKTKK